MEWEATHWVASCAGWNGPTALRAHTNARSKVVAAVGAVAPRLPAAKQPDAGNDDTNERKEPNGEPNNVIAE